MQQRDTHSDAYIPIHRSYGGSHLFTNPKLPEARGRNVRFLYIMSIIGGALVGGGLYRAGGSSAVLWTSTGIKLLTMVWICFIDLDLPG